ncbi:NAD(P)H-hydrate dehydratase [Clostridium botulinum]|uniref:NAD(P)H-hydrate dehydratase n=1 Tax=Clostridium botulinum TaxID=1491 RepID=UPI00052D6619|nr:NAD(P)H-hydrate dehydratase [Clostridium botulinum]KGM95763.1 carbohydrate kinase [Clostridium botulinum D str. CCUG 7971]NFO96785.1 NAD(P)H-hydrate dehydratase [Clostridium botulinum]OOV52481.1 bifunctional ADP-dependent (S)-NAD(P)H-hydrate dehydratase/NAD(P)H-hydrate epimerase [Clostridium botulinum D/C]OOV54946.1 bifunctional ADP-dependent (S)-NAD(P)H-hydrate dehydratase/NAD(P)H-hydrate epimerase [Clostridium botulinum D/C]OOV56633.1 bifunctional ADP-dependent (S)-NAD(P)H-hydrate dehydra
MEIVTAQKMRDIDKFSIENIGIPSMVLMENAALKVLKNINMNILNSFTIICGNGNNGGDGLALARHLSVLKKQVDIFIIGSEDTLSKDCENNYKILCNMNSKVLFIKATEDIEFIRRSMERRDIVIDAIFGTGLSREIKGIHKEVIFCINKVAPYVIAIDTPSGLNSDTGEILGCCVKANKTISFEFYKKGFLNYESFKYIGELIVESIGIPKSVTKNFFIHDYLIEKENIKNIIPIRVNYLHKGDFGRTSIVAGSVGFTGAAYIATQAAVRCGAGLVTLCCPEKIQDILSNKLVEAMTISFKDKGKLNYILKKSDSIAVGPGMGNNEGTLKILGDIIRYTNCPIVIDADAINVLKDNLQILKEKNNKIVLTPHVGEMSRITGIPVDTINKNRIDIARQFSKEYDIIVLLKGYNTIITDGITTMVNTTGNSAMASGGMGDCLTGIIAALMSQGFEAFEAAYVGAYIHGYSGDKLSKNRFCVNATHILEELPFLLKELQV